MLVKNYTEGHVSKGIVLSFAAAAKLLCREEKLDCSQCVNSGRCECPDTEQIERQILELVLEESKGQNTEGKVWQCGS
jgi:hypothetical protein